MFILLSLSLKITTACGDTVHTKSFSYVKCDIVILKPITDIFEYVLHTSIFVTGFSKGVNFAHASNFKEM